MLYIYIILLRFIEIAIPLYVVSLPCYILPERNCIITIGTNKSKLVHAMITSRVVTVTSPSDTGLSDSGFNSPQLRTIPISLSFHLTTCIFVHYICTRYINTLVRKHVQCTYVYVYYTTVYIVPRHITQI